MNQDNSDLQFSPELNKSSNRKRKLLIVLSLIGITAGIIFLLFAFRPEAKKQAIPETIVRVDVIKANRTSYPIIVNANGTIEAETRGDLVSQISGEIIEVSDNFKTGGSFKKGDVLIQIDQRDFRANLSQSLASLSQAQASYSQEQANAKQAELDWQRLGNSTPVPPLVGRKPQLAAAKAQLESAKAAYQTAQLNLSRTTLKAPYDGRVIERHAVLGQFLTVGAPVAEVFATDGVEVRLPISQNEFNQLGLNSFTNASQSDDYKVVLSTTVGVEDYQWQADITRTDSTFDINTRQIDIIATVNDPFGKGSGQPALKIGQFVTAVIQGRVMDNVFVIPNKSIREGNYLYLVRNGILQKQPIKLLWQDDQNALINDEINEGELVVTTSLNSTLAGARAKLPEEFANAFNANEQEVSTAIDPSTSE